MDEKTLRSLWGEELPSSLTLSGDFGQTIKSEMESTVQSDRQDETESESSVSLDESPEGEPIPIDNSLEILDQIGEGGMGIVYQAEQKCLERTVAVKTQRVASKSDSAFYAEAYVTGGLEHPNIIPVHSLRVDSMGRSQLTMKLVTGSSWRDRLLETGLPIRDGHLTEQFEIIDKVCFALAFAHSRDILHLDIKPANIMLGDFGEVYVLDWGVAVSITENHSTPHLMFRGDVSCPRGTPSYMSPEQAKGDGTALVPATDVFQLGVVLYEILTGRVPHRGKNVISVLLGASVGKIEDWPEDIPAELIDIVKKALAPNIADRYQEIGDFQRALKEFRSHQESVTISDAAQRKFDQCLKTVAQWPLGDSVTQSLYQDFSDSVSAYEQALLLWPANSNAAHRLQAARIAYAEFAIRCGDLKLAESVLSRVGKESKAAEVSESLLSAQKSRIHQKNSQQRLILASITFVLIFIIGLLVSLNKINKAWKEEEEQRKEAKKAWEAEAEQRKYAQNRLREVTRLSDQRTVDGLKKEAAQLWPLNSRLIPQFNDWVGRAEKLAENLDTHKRALKELRSRSKPYSEEQRKNDRLTFVDYEKMQTLKLTRTRLKEIVKSIQLAKSREDFEKLKIAVEEFGIIRAQLSSGTLKKKLRTFRKLAFSFQSLSYLLDQEKLLGDAQTIGSERVSLVAAIADTCEVLTNFEGKDIPLSLRVELNELTETLSLLDDPAYKESVALERGLLAAGVGNAKGTLWAFQQVPRLQPRIRAELTKVLGANSAAEAQEMLRKLTVVQRGEKLTEAIRRVLPEVTQALVEISGDFFKKGREVQGELKALALSTIQPFLESLDELEVEIGGQIQALTPEYERRRTWSFDSLEDQWKHALLSKLVGDINNLQEIELANIKERLKKTREMKRRTVEAEQHSWQLARTSIADKVQCSRYDGLSLSDIEGLIPLGMNRSTGLWEFTLPASGEMPSLGRNGLFTISEETGIVFVLIPGGEFSMGAKKPSARFPIGSDCVDPEADNNEFPISRIRLKPFLISKYEVTQGQWKRLGGGDPSSYRKNSSIGKNVIDDRHPVESITWSECDEILKRFSMRLPTEAQWEYAAKGGHNYRFGLSYHKEDLKGFANIADATFLSNGGRQNGEKWLTDGYVCHAPVGSFRPNQFGLHDILGNVMEWCFEDYNLYGSGHLEGTEGLFTIRIGNQKCARGGSWNFVSQQVRVTQRFRLGPDNRYGYLGLRPIMILDKAK